MVLYSPDLVTGDHETDAARAEGKVMAQRTLFAGPSPQAPDDLYCLAETGVMVRDRGRMVLHGHARVTTNTYFGRFPASYWQRWTSVAGGRRRAVVSGRDCPVWWPRTSRAKRARSPPTGWSTPTARPCGCPPGSTGSSTAARCGWSQTTTGA